MSPEKLVAVAAIHEEDFSLEDLTVDELEKLQKAVEVQLAKKLQEHIPLEEWSYEAPDDRSYGRLQFRAKTLHGVLEYDGSIGSDGMIEQAKVLLHHNRPGELNDGPDEVGETFEGPYEAMNNMTQDEAKTHVVKVLLDWQASYENEG